MKKKKSLVSKEKETFPEVKMLVKDIMKIPDHGIFERQKSGIIWSVLNYKDPYQIWEGKQWTNNLYRFSCNPYKDLWGTPCFKTNNQESIKTDNIIIVRDNRGFYVKNTTTGGIYIINPDENAELLYTNEAEFVRTQEFLNR